MPATIRTAITAFAVLAATSTAQADSGNDLKWYVLGVMSQIEFAGGCQLKKAGFQNIQRGSIADIVRVRAFEIVAAMEARKASVSNTQHANRVHVAIVAVLRRDVCVAPGDPA